MALRSFLTGVVHKGSGAVLYGKNFSTIIIRLDTYGPCIFRQNPPTNSTQIRNLMKDLNSPRSKPRKRQDNVTKEHRYIYGSTVDHYIIYSLPIGIGLASLLIYIAYGPLYNHYVNGITPEPIQLGSFTFDNFISFYLGSLTFVLIYAVLAMYIYRRTVLRMYHHAGKDQYVAILAHPTGTRKLEFNFSDIGYNPKNARSLLGSLEVKGKRYLISKDNFVVPSDFHRLRRSSHVQDSEQMAGGPAGQIEKYLREARQHIEEAREKHAENQKQKRQKK